MGREAKGLECSEVRVSSGSTHNKKARVYVTTRRKVVRTARGKCRAHARTDTKKARSVDSKQGGIRLSHGRQ